MRERRGSFGSARALENPWILVARSATRGKLDRARRKDYSRTTNWKLRRATPTNLFLLIAIYHCRISTPYLLVVASLASTFSDLRARFRSTKLRVRSGIGDIQFRRTRPTRVRGNLGTFRDNSVATTLIYTPNKQRISSSAIRLFGVAIAREERLFVWNGVTNGTVARTCA